MSYYQRMIYVMGTANYLEYMFAKTVSEIEQDMICPVQAMSKCPSIVWC